MYIQLDRHKEACTELEAARLSFRELGTPPDIVRAGECALQIAKSWRYTFQSEGRIARMINEAQTDLKDDPKGTARALISLGESFRWMNRPSEGLEHLKVAHAALQDLSCTADVAECLFAMSRCYALLGVLPEWQRVAQACLEASRVVGMNELIAQALRSLSRCYIRQELYDNALDTLREALRISEQLGHPPAIVSVLELSGYAYSKQRDFVGARLAYEEAKKMSAGMVRAPQTQSREDRCERNLRAILERDSDGDIELDPPFLV
ncbi:hypothetical protein AX14_009655 [Amanita brunnescens Koide BX004]|nr:hypothetical protein AX14_009655 [Amanita brunnescens Koide BX004]